MNSESNHKEKPNTKTETTSMMQCRILGSPITVKLAAYINYIKD